MDYKQSYTNQLNTILGKATALSKIAKNELAIYLQNTIDLMERELNDEIVDWSALSYLENQEAQDFFEKELNDFVLSWKFDESDIISLDKQILAILKEQGDK